MIISLIQMQETSKHIPMMFQYNNNKLSENQLVNQFLINKLFKQSDKNQQLQHCNLNQFKFYKIQAEELLTQMSKLSQKKNMKN